jgi:WD40 repeat protein/class 3 adenylate cyclase
VITLVQEKDTAGSTTVRTFLIADVRGYTRFTRERGDSAAALLAKRFADLARDVVEARSGRVLELRGDEALAVFESPAQAVRAAVEFQATCAEESAADPALPLPVGIGIDVGEAISVEDGYRGAALNMAARLCSNAAAGQALVTRAIVDAAGSLDGEVDFVERGPASFKGFEQAVEVIEALAVERVTRPSPLPAEVVPVPPELDPMTPLVDRERELRWLRGTWRQVRRGGGRVLFVSGPAQIGKTRLAAEIAAHVHREGASVRYAGPGGTATALALAELRQAVKEDQPTLLVLDDVDVAGPAVARAITSSLPEVASKPLLLLGLLRDPGASAELAAALELADERGDGHRTLGPLDLEGVRAIVRLYAGEEAAEVPVESMARASGGLPGRVHEVVSDWAGSEASRRLAAAAEFLAAGRDRQASNLEFANNVIGLKLGRLYTVEGRDVLAVETCPYKGLAPFEERDSAYFFGRERLVGELAARTVQAGLLAVVGASGSGKSSVVAAGLLPSLRAGLLPGSGGWTQAAIRPGEHPMRELRRALSAEEEDPLGAALGGLPPDGRLVLFVDQFEEVFTLCASEGEQAEFIETLARAARRSPERVAVVLTIRGDYYAHAASYPDLAEALAANHVLVGPLSREELRRAVELPARRAGLRVESALVDALIEEVAEEPGGLPLLSTALVELWHARAGGWLRMEAHERTGGLRGAVSRLAESSYEQLSDVEKAAARRMFLRLVAAGEGGTVTKRRVELEEFDLDRDDVAAAVLTKLTQDRLLTMSDASVEVAHEALLREWPRLEGWLEEDAQGRQLRQHLTQASRQWDLGGREASELYRGPRLSATLDWSAGHAAELNELEREFLTASRQAAEQESERQGRTNRRLRGLLVGVAGFLVLAIVAGAFALVQRGQARHQALVATSQRVGAQALLQSQLDRSLLLAREALKLDDSVETRSDLLGALLKAPQAARIYHGNGHRLLVVALSPDRRTLAMGDNNGFVTFADTTSGQTLGPQIDYPGGAAATISIGFSPDGKTFLESTDSAHGGTARLFDARSHEEIAKLPIPRSKFAGGPNVQFLSDGRVAVAAVDGSAFFWNPDTEKSTKPLELHNGDFAYALFSPDGRLAAATTEKPNETAIWNLQGRKRLDVFDVSGYPLAFSRDASMLASGAEDGSVRIVDLARGEVRVLSARHDAAVQSVGFTPDGKTLVSTGDDRKVIVWDVKSSVPRETLSGHAGRVLSLAISPDGQILYTGSLDATAIGWDLAGRRRLGRSFTVPTTNQYFAATLSPDGRVAAVTQTNTQVRLIDTKALRRLGPPLEGNGDVPINTLWFSPDGKLLAGTESAEGQANDVNVWDVATRELVQRISLPKSFGNLGPLRWTPDGRLMVVGSSKGRLAVLDVQRERRLADWKTGNPVYDLSISSDGRLVAAALPTEFGGTAPDQAGVWTLQGRKVRTLDTSPFAVAFSPDGHTLAAGGGTGIIKQWDVRTGKPVGIPMQAVAGYVITLNYNPSGSTIAAGGTDGTVTLWDAATQKQLGSALPGPGNVWVGAWWSGDGKTLVTFYQDGHGFFWNVDSRDWATRACSVAGRNLTRDEWRLFLPERPLERVCPQYPILRRYGEG